MTKQEAARQIVVSVSSHYGVGFISLLIRDLDRVIRARKLTDLHKRTVLRARQACEYAVGTPKARALTQALVAGDA